MKNLGVNEIRELFLQFFESKDHLRLKSFSVVPRNDKSLLLINSGMAPMKAYFTGQETPPSKRVTTCQKCIRTGDIDNVGKTARHGTFFEMLGDFSFGDYFKNEIIPWSWEFVTKWLEIPEDKLYVTIYEEDDETGEIWHEKVGLPWDRIKKLGKEDNFWQHGTGPCGPCTEIYYDRGPEYGCNSPTCGVGCDCDRYMEFWNLVLTQFDAHEDGTYTELDHKNVDTGMGLERMATIMQGVDSIFDVDTVKYIRDVVCQKAGVEYGKEHKIDVSVRIITDHIRSVTIMTADGVLPSNEGRGYVLRRLLRRAARHGKLLGIQGEFLAELSKAVITCSGEAYPELVDKQDYIFKILSIEENSFYKTIDKGMEILKEDMEEMKAAGETVMSGEKSFRLYDTYGFPVDLTKEILEEALNSYTGTVLYVSHDRYFINQTATRILDLTNQSVVNYIGDYDYYLEKKEELTEKYAPSAQEATEETKEETPSEGRLTWQQQKEEQARKRKQENELKKVEKRIEELETRDKEIDDTLVLPDVCTNVGRCAELSREKDKIQAELEELYEKWEELA